MYYVIAGGARQTEERVSRGRVSKDDGQVSGFRRRGLEKAEKKIKTLCELGVCAAIAVVNR